MRVIYDSQEIAHLLEESQVQQHFDSEGLAFQCFQYEKGEILCSPLNPIGYLLFLVSGTVQIYDLRQDGNKVPVAFVSGVKLFGDIEFSTNKPTAFFAEALEDVICIALPIEKYKGMLNHDLRFLHCLINSMAEKFEYYANIEILSQTLEEKVVLYLKYKADDHEIRSIEKTLLQLRCSRRQLQRVLKKLCDTGKIMKLGKGHYQLMETENHIL